MWVWILLNLLIHWHHSVVNSRIVSCWLTSGFRDTFDWSCPANDQSQFATADSVWTDRWLMSNFTQWPYRSHYLSVLNIGIGCLKFLVLISLVRWFLNGPRRWITTCFHCFTVMTKNLVALSVEQATSRALSTMKQLFNTVYILIRLIITVQKAMLLLYYDRPVQLPQSVPF